MDKGQFWTMMGVLLTVGGSIIGLIISGRNADRVAARTAVADAYADALPIWKASIEELQRKALTADERIAALEAELTANRRWKQVAVRHIVELHTYLRAHLHRDDTPAVPAELEKDLPAFRRVSRG